MNVLLLRLEAPLISFGGVTIDSYGVIDDLPSVSMLTGLLGNALGWRRTDSERLQSLQDRIRYVVRLDRAGTRIRDFQTAQLSKDDKAWTTHGVPQKRAGGAQSYDSPHLRYRDFHADASVAIALALDPENKVPSIEDCAAALMAPARPLFLGRKSCIPGGVLVADTMSSASLLEAMEHFPLADGHDPETEINVFQVAEPPFQAGDVRLAGHRHWASDSHQGIEYWRRSIWNNVH